MTDSLMPLDPPARSSHSRPSRRRPRLIVAALVLIVLPLGVSILRMHAPSEASFYPRCWLKSLTGLNCPGCGATRCLHVLCNGELAQAFAYNPLLTLALPFLLWGAFLESYAAWTGRTLFRYRLSRRIIFAIFWLLLVYWVARNIDIYPLTLLAPHELK